MDAHERRRFQLAMPIAWLGIAIGMFLYLFDLDRYDDYAGWIIVMLVTQVPAYLALVTAVADRPFGRGRAFAFAVPGALMIALAGFFVGSMAGLVIWPPVPFEFRPYALGLAVALIALIVGLVRQVRVLRGVPHPRAARRALGGVAIAGLLAVLAAAARSSDMARAPLIWIVVVVPVVWTAPMWFVVRDPRRIPEARVRAVS